MCFPSSFRWCARSSRSPPPRCPRAHEKRAGPAAAPPAVQGLLAPGVRAPVRAHALDQGQVQALRALLASRRPYPRNDLREALDAHAPLVRGGNAPARRRGDLPVHAGFAAWAGGAGRGRRAGDFADVRSGDDTHLPAGDTVALCRELARPGDQRPHQDRKSTRLNSSHSSISYAVFCLKKKKKLIAKYCSEIEIKIKSISSK